jgi:aryl-alcohol dehydrogenase-like predicted oxidoreductase
MEGGGMKQGIAAQSGSFRLGGELEIHRLGYGAMRVTGPGIWGPPQDKAEALRTLRRVPELGINFIDTADSYGPHVSEELLREALHPYDGLVIATKGGLVRPGPDRWLPNGRPEYLIECCKASLKRLGVERIDLWQLHRIDAKVPRDEQFGAVRRLLDEGYIRFAGLSEVSVAEVEAAARVFPVASVQNRYNYEDRGSEDALGYCEQRGIGFIPWYPLSAGALTRESGELAELAEGHGATRGQVALAWLLARSPVMLPIPGTSRVAHLEENAAASALVLAGMSRPA